MKLSDIDFSAVANMMNSLSDDQKASLNQMADQMMAKMRPHFDEDLQQAEADLEQSQAAEDEEAEEEIEYFEGLHLGEEYQALPESTLKALEAAWDLENFYDRDPEADYSASMLFLQKALGTLLQETLYPLCRNVLNLDFCSRKDAQHAEMNDYINALLNPVNVEKLSAEGFADPDFWSRLRFALSHLASKVYQAQIMPVSLEEVDSAKALLLDDGLLLQLKAL